MKLRRYDPQAEADILSDYVDVLNHDGLESSAELRFLRRHERDQTVMRLLRGVRQLKAALSDGCRSIPPHTLVTRPFNAMTADVASAQVSRARTSRTPGTRLALLSHTIPSRSPHG